MGRALEATRSRHTLAGGHRHGEYASGAVLARAGGKFEIRSQRPIGWIEDGPPGLRLLLIEGGTTQARITPERGAGIRPRREPVAALAPGIRTRCRLSSWKTGGPEAETFRGCTGPGAVAGAERVDPHAAQGGPIIWIES